MVRPLRLARVAAQAEVLALSTGRPMKPLSAETIAYTQAQIRGEAGKRNSSRLHLDSVKRILDREAPEYAS